MLNISCLTGTDLKSRKNVELINEKHENVFKGFKDSNPSFYKFSKMMLYNIPLNFIEILTDDDFVKFIEYLFKAFNNRKKRKFSIDVAHAFNTDFFIGNFSIITLVTDDRPFLVDSIREYFYEIKFEQKFIIHPIFNVKRDRTGQINILNEPGIGTSNESFVVIFMEDVDENQLKDIRKELESIYNEVILAVDDFAEMSILLSNLSELYKNSSPETSEFIKWLLDENFIIQGIRVLNNIDMTNGDDYDLEQLGVYKLNRTIKMIPSLIEAIKSKSLNFIDDYPVIVDKALFKSKVKKRKNYDRLMFFDKNGDKYNVITVIGIFSKNVNKTPPHKISITRKKVAEVFNNFKFVHGSHDYKWIRDILEVFPKTELFNFDSNTITDILEVILSIQGKNQLRIYWKSYASLKHFYCFMAIPIEKFSNELANDVSRILEDMLNGKTLDVSIRHDEHGYSYIHYNIYIKKTEFAKNFDEELLKERIIPLLKEWEDELVEAIRLKFSSRQADLISSKYSRAFSDTYKTRTSPNEAAVDISYLENLSEVSSYLHADKEKVVLKIYSKRSILLTDIIPIFDNTGLKVNEENIFKVKTNNEIYYINSIYIANIENHLEFKEKFKNRLTELIVSVIKYETENDDLNKLLILTDLNYRQIDVLRAIRNYIEQIEHTFRRKTINETLNNNCKIAEMLVELFDNKLNPDIKTDQSSKLNKKILESIDGVKSVAEDTILRHFVKVLNCILRTNFYRKPTRNFLSFKVDSRRLDILPDPKPMFEIYVHNAHMEGVHLRGGKVARGGLRFSDRPDDFRTEILGLVKTQIVKNAVIVPTGSKGGFIVKQRFDDREKDKEHVITQYKTFIRGLLDITDNYSGKKVVHPENVKILDDNDPYLVVAADKGTATFSDIANSISLEYGFWLGDAFASGGSTGYDHKKVGITARGAWESVKRHFRELGKDCQREDFTVIGIGDMSGDVFGNGMLLSKKIRLLAAFNHIHIFLDPNPDSSVSYKERKRLFKLPRSTWKDYNPELISKGGGVFDRSAKKIELSPEVKEMLGVSLNYVNGEQLISLILKMKAELLWNGGIGTYVKHPEETHLDVGDAANDGVRVNADELRVQIVGEGGNLGFTQRARILFSQLGGKMYTDALDNSAGVDMSDHEVNLKIMLDHILKKRLLKDSKERDKFVLALTDEVTDLVLKDNYLQSQIVSCDELRSDKNLIAFVETANFLKEKGLLDFKIEQLRFIDEDRKPTRPELAVLLAYIKIYLLDVIEENFDMENPIIKELYKNYYPKSLLKKFEDQIYEHKLKKEIAITVLVNKVINQAGITFFIELFKNTGKDFLTLIEKYILAEKLLKFEEVRSRIEKLDGKINANVQYQMLIEVEKTLKVAVEWLVNDANEEMIKNNLEMFNKLASNISRNLKGYLKENYKKLLNDFIKNGVSKELARDICDIRYLKPAFDMFEMSQTYGFDSLQTIKNYLNVACHLKLHLIVKGIKQIKIKTSWDRINRENLLRRTKDLQKKLAIKVMQNEKNWLSNLEKKEQAFFEGYNEFLADIEKDNIETMVPYNVMLDSFFNLTKRY
jgi:glutamate dehydrogenase